MLADDCCQICISSVCNPAKLPWCFVWRRNKLRHLTSCRPCSKTWILASIDGCARESLKNWAKTAKNTDPGWASSSTAFGGLSNEFERPALANNERRASASSLATSFRMLCVDTALPIGVCLVLWLWVWQWRRLAKQIAFSYPCFCGEKSQLWRWHFCLFLFFFRMRLLVDCAHDFSAENKFQREKGACKFACWK